MAKVKLTRSQMAFASGESLDDFDKRTGGKDPTAGVVVGNSSPFFDSDDDDSDVLVDDTPPRKKSSKASGQAGSDDGGDGEIDQSQYLPDGSDDDSGSGDGGGDGGGNDGGTGSKQASKVSVPDWADDDAREFAASYGLSDADLGTFDDIDDLYEYGRKTDRSLASGGDSGSGAASKPKDDTAESSKKPSKQDKGDASPSLLDRLKPIDRQKYVDAKYGEEELQLVDGLNATIEAVRQVLPGIQQQQTSKQQESERREAEEFNQALDDLNPKTFGQAVIDGKIGDLSDGFRRNRLKVHEAMERLANGIADDQQRQGKEVQLPPVRILAQRAAAMVFGETEPVRSSRPSSDAVAQQSRRRRPTSSVGKRGASGGTVAKGTAKDDARSILANPALQRFWKQTQRENGAE